MKRQLPGGFELDDDKARVDLKEVHRYLSEESYWAEGRPFETVEMSVRDASRIVGLYEGERQIGFARTFTDGIKIAYIADVYVLEEFRGRGLGLELVREAVDNSPFVGMRWMLHTRDGHGLYAKLGFGPPSDRVMERSPDWRPTSAPSSQPGV